MPGQLQDPKDSHDPEDLDHTAHILKLVRRVLIGLKKKQGHEIRHDGQEVNNVEATFEELPLVWGSAKAEDVLESKPGDAHRLDHRQLRIVLKVALFVIDLKAGDGVERQSNRR